MEDYNDEIISVEELCERLKIGKNKAYELLSSGKIKGFRIDRNWKTPVFAITDYIMKECKDH